LKPDKGWQRRFDDPIPLPRGRQLVTLAATYITKLPKAEHEAEEWQAAIEALMLVARGGPTMLARIGVMRALNREVERVFNPDRKNTRWGKRKLKRDE
jgi:hypothetical protein